MNPMMRIGLILLLVIFQTTMYLVVPALSHFVDLLITYVIYAGLFLSIVESTILIFLLGIFMDSITIGPFGLYLSIYLWILLGLQPFITLLNLKNTHSLRLLLCIAVIFENMMMFLGTVILKQEIGLSSEALRESVFQLGWTLLLGPYLIQMLCFADRRLHDHAQSN
jgi:rod shape-determining protein MreD